MDSAIRDVVGIEVTTDAEVFEGLVDQVEGDIEQISAVGAYDTCAVYEAACKRNAQLIVPPRDNAVSWEDGHSRTQALAHIAEQGIKAWKK